MSEQQLSPENMLAENGLICEKLLGWVKIHPARPIPGINFLGWRRPTDGEQLSTPSFTTWADAGLILEAISHRSVDVGNLTDCWYCDIDGMLPVPNAPTGPLAVRAAALEWIRSLP